MFIKYVSAAALILAGSMANAATVQIIDAAPEANSGLTGEFHGYGTHDLSGSYYGAFYGYGPISPWEGTETPYASYTALEVSGGGFGYGYHHYRYGEEVISFETAQDSLSLLWGTPSGTDYVTFALSDGSSETVSGSQIGSTGYYLITPSQSFTSVTFTATYSPFEYAAVQSTAAGSKISEESGDVAPVPLPATGMLLVGAFAGLGALTRRRRS